MIIYVHRVLRRLKVLAIVTALILLLTSKWFWRQFYPFPYQETIVKYSVEYQIDPFLVAAIIRTESRFSTEAESYRGARGIMQIMPDTGKWAAEQMNLEGFKPEDLYKPETNIRIGCWYVANLTKEFGGERAKILAAYNAGRGNVRDWLQSKQWNGKYESLEDIPFEETRKYVERVTKSYDKYVWLYSE